MFQFLSILFWFRTVAGKMKDLFRTVAGKMKDLFRTVAGEMKDLFRTVAGEMKDLFRTVAGEMKDLFRIVAGKMKYLFRTVAGKIKIKLLIITIIHIMFYFYNFIKYYENFLSVLKTEIVNILVMKTNTEH